MPIYRVSFEATASLCIDVEAVDAEAAIEAAFEETPSGVCAQCSGWGQRWDMDMGEWDIPQKNGRDADWAIEEVPA